MPDVALDGQVEGETIVAETAVAEHVRQQVAQRLAALCRQHLPRALQLFPPPRVLRTEWQLGRHGEGQQWIWTTELVGVDAPQSRMHAYIRDVLDAKTTLHVLPTVRLGSNHSGCHRKVVCIAIPPQTGSAGYVLLRRLTLPSPRLPPIERR